MPRWVPGEPASGLTTPLSMSAAAIARLWKLGVLGTVLRTAGSAPRRRRDPLVLHRSFSAVQLAAAREHGVVGEQGVEDRIPGCPLTAHGAEGSDCGPRGIREWVGEDPLPAPLGHRDRLGPRPRRAALRSELRLRLPGGGAPPAGRLHLGPPHPRRSRRHGHRRCGEGSDRLGRRPSTASTAISSATSTPTSSSPRISAASVPCHPATSPPPSMSSAAARRSSLSIPAGSMT